MGYDLLPCPFCCGTAEIYNPFHMIGNPGQPATYRGGVRCGACGCESKATTPPDAAVIAWNRRTDAAPQASEAVRDQDLAPWPDYAGNPIRHGDRIRHPEGLEGVVVRLPGYADAHDAWCVAYQDRTVSRLSLQIGDRGQAVVQSARSAQPGAQRTGGSDDR